MSSIVYILMRQLSGVNNSGAFLKDRFEGVRLALLTHIGTNLTHFHAFSIHLSTLCA